MNPVNGQTGSGFVHHKARMRVFAARFARRRLAVFGLVVVVLLFSVAALADVIAAYDPVRPNARAILQPPSREHLLGTDNLGRDVFSRIVYGARISLQVAVFSVVGAAGIGVALGVLAGFFRGWVDEILMRVMDAIRAFPTIVLALAITAALGPSLTNAMVALAVVNVPAFARLARGQVLVIQGFDYVDAAKALGISAPRLIIRHIMPNSYAPLIVQGTLLMGQAIIIEASLGFLGLGVQPPTPSWGSMLRTGYPQMETAAWLSVFPGCAIFLTVLAMNLVGDGLRDAIDVKLS